MNWRVPTFVSVLGIGFFLGVGFTILTLARAGQQFVWSKQDDRVVIEVEGVSPQELAAVAPIDTAQPALFAQQLIGHLLINRADDFFESRQMELVSHVVELEKFRLSGRCPREHDD